jgi:hypothetical protein
MHVQSSQVRLDHPRRKVLPAGGFGNFDPGIVIREGAAPGSGTRMGANMSTT